MKKDKSILEHTLKVLLTIVFVPLFAVLNGQHMSDIVEEAYVLRMHGKADSAALLIGNALAQDSTNAAYWFELTRTYQHLGYGNPAEMIDYHQKAITTLQQAIELEPSNAYFHFYKGKLEALNLYIALQQGEEDLSTTLFRVEDSFTEAAALDPGCADGLLSLVEFYYFIPEEQGGSKEKALAYARQLEGMDVVASARAKELLMEEDADYVAYWKSVQKEHPEWTQVEEALGRAYLFSNDFNSAQDCFRKAMNADPNNNVLFLDLGRYQMMMALWGQAKLDSVAPLIESEFDKYLKSSPEPSGSMQAWVYFNLSMVKFKTGQEEEGKDLRARAQELDPFHPKAIGLPDQAIYCRPGVQKKQVGYYFRPF